MYSPNKWVVVKIEVDNKFPVYKVVAGFAGGYLYGDSWKLNSGIVKVEEDKDSFYFHGYSGSVYRCFKESYGINMIMQEPIQRLESINSDKVKIEILPPDTDFMNLNLDRGLLL